MVMGFFRRVEEQGKIASAAAGQQAERGELQDLMSFGAVVAESELSSEDLLSGLGSLQNRVSSLLKAHGEALAELSELRTERARIASLLDYETTARRRLDIENQQISAENKELRSENSQMRLELDQNREKLIKLQAQFDANSNDLEVVHARLRDVSRELDERIAQYDETASLLRRAHHDLDQRNREFAQLREKYENEKTAHQVLVETSRREADAQAREIDRLNEERSQLKRSLSHQDTQARNLSTEAAGLRQELVFAEEKAKRLQAELENHQSSTTVEMAQLSTKYEAVNSKAELVEKLLITARGRAKLAEDELSAVRGELKEMKSDLATTTLRADRLAQELSAARAGNTENESVRRDLSLQVSELTMRLRETENQRNKRERDMETMRRDLDHRAQSDQEEIRQLRASAEVSKAEIRQLKAEIAILTGQLEVVRNERSGQVQIAPPAPPMPKATFEEWVPEDEAPKPIIELSDKALRATPPRPAAEV
ncbi:hypothetical protein J5J10_20870 [Ciceribacter sp. L1K23]|uniref:hypothetical protein n=1 Tax=Ciceribacter sp. L1K23 TaxID=2820276 RepID=UPI001B838805|nr:hypothetical protein [Ciceribacter sp. L1K23]MBR0558153.1 hypothetical protein [Ciceribacter sp. L1K23]